MTRFLRSLSWRYAATLRRFLVRQEEVHLQRAYEIGRKALGWNLGILDVARIHQQALALYLPPSVSPTNRRRSLKAAEIFFMETLSPFEAAHRGFREANVKLHQLNAALEGRNAELAVMNRELATEVRDRKRTEKELRESERHYRQLFHQACIMQKKLQDLSNQILHAQEEERTRISRELHDQVGQALTAIHINLSMLQRQRDGAGEIEVSHEKIADTQELLEQAMDTVHAFARELRPTMLDELGLLPALRSYMKGFAQRSGHRVHFYCNTNAEDLTSEGKTVLFRVAQESLTNVAKHAQATRVDVTLRKTKSAVRMEIKDNGKAFPVHQARSGSGKMRLGLLGMQERTRLVDGSFSVKSVPGKGTTVCVEIPRKPAMISSQKLGRLKGA